VPSPDPHLSAQTPVLREANAGDMAAITAIYREYVLNGLASFETEPPDAAAMDDRRRAVQDLGLPYLVADMDGAIAGYAYAGRYRPHIAYRHTVENSIYVSPDWGRRGIGMALMTAIIQRCTALGYRQMVAVIGDSANHGSIRLHEKAGFHQVGFLPSVGRKLDQWVDSILMQRPLGDGDASPPDAA